jgi:hypothetical protein
MARTRPTAKDAEAICRRLNQFVHRRYDSWSAFEEAFGIPRTTRLGWSRRKNPSVPEVPILLRLAREANLNLNWLLLGELPELRVSPADNPVEQFYAIIEAELRATEKAGPVDFDFVWRQMKARSDIASSHDDTIVGLAVDGVRSVFQEVLRSVRRTDALAKWLMEAQKGFGPTGQRVIAPEEGTPAAEKEKKQSGTKQSTTSRPKDLTREDE